MEISSGTELQPDAVVATLHTTFILASQKKSSGARPQEDQTAWTPVGTWHTAGNDGFRFALLTGDFNPIHWIGLAGRLSPFKRKVLHGFGMFVRSYEVLAAQGAIKEIDVRFLKPVALPSGELRVEQSAPDAQGWRTMRLVGNNGQLHLVGRFRR
jgi:acyl dehydratase